MFTKLIPIAMSGMLALSTCQGSKPVSHQPSHAVQQATHCTKPYGAIGQFITVHRNGSSDYGTNGSASHVYICTHLGWQHV